MWKLNPGFRKTDLSSIALRDPVDERNCGKRGGCRRYGHYAHEHRGGGGNQFEKSWADLLIISNFYVVPLLRRLSGINHTKIAIGRRFDSIINCFCPNDLLFATFNSALEFLGHPSTCVNLECSGSLDLAHRFLEHNQIK